MLVGADVGQHKSCVGVPFPLKNKGPIQTYAKAEFTGRNLEELKNTEDCMFE